MNTTDSLFEGTTSGDALQQQGESHSIEEQKITHSNLRAKQISNLRTATTPKDSTLEKSVSLPREERLGKPLPVEVDSKRSDKQSAEYSRQSSEYNRVVSIQPNAERLIPHPWHRFFARILDSIAIAIIVAAPPAFTTLAYSALQVEQGKEVGLIFAYVFSILVALFYEPAMLAIFGTTLGKAFFKISIKDQRTGQNLTFGTAIKRYLWMLWYTGQILSLVPIVGFIAPFVGQIMQYKKLVRDKITSYDEHLKVRYEHG